MQYLTLERRELLEITKIQILKVIHNSKRPAHTPIAVVGSHKDTNFESNSQRMVIQIFTYSSCFKSQRYKF